MLCWEPLRLGVYRAPPPWPHCLTSLPPPVLPQPSRSDSPWCLSVCSCDLEQVPSLPFASASSPVKWGENAVEGSSLYSTSPYCTSALRQALDSLTGLPHSVHFFQIIMLHVLQGDGGRLRYTVARVTQVGGGGAGSLLSRLPRLSQMQVSPKA